jgi:hypothetical protein
MADLQRAGKQSWRYRFSSVQSCLGMKTKTGLKITFAWLDRAESKWSIGSNQVCGIYALYDLEQPNGSSCVAHQ